MVDRMTDPLAGKAAATRPELRRAKGPDGKSRLLSAAVELLCGQPPSSIAGRALARKAGVHHTLIGQIFGDLPALLATAYSDERDAFAQAAFSVVGQPIDGFAVAGHANFWKPYVYFVLDPSHGAIQAALGHNSIPRQASQHLHHDDPSLAPANRDAIAAAWWSTQIGALVFDKALNHGLGISLRQREHVRDLAARWLDKLFQSPPNAIKPSTARAMELAASPKKPTQGREGKEWALIQAAINLLYDRAESGVSGRELAQRANANYGLIHHYFGSKEAVFDQAFIYLHGLYVDDMVGGQAQRLGLPFQMVRHEAFIHAWACRELAGIAMPTVDLAGMRIFLTDLLASRGISGSNSAALAQAQADVYCAIALQLGYTICRTHLGATLDTEPEAVLSRLMTIHRWLVTGTWPR